MARTKTAPFNPEALLAKIGGGKTIVDYRDKQAVFSQGGAADAVFYIQKGKVKLTVVSPQGKEAIVAILEYGNFFGEDCLAGQSWRMATAIPVEDSTIVRFQREAMVRLLHEEPEFSELFISHLLSRNTRIQEDLVDQLFNSSEKRLARTLLLLAHFGKDGQHEHRLPNISHETLAQMVGTTRPRICFFMNRFRELGFIDYSDGLLVRSSLLNIVLYD
ncbi:MAG: Crp/Fnr family transcriptional regulator [Terriglobia bacterium]